MTETRLPKLPAGVSEAFLKLLEQPVSFHPALARLCGSAAAGLMLSQAIYWSRMKQVQQRGGWFFKDNREWTAETCLTRNEQAGARKILERKGFLEVMKKKHDGAPTLHFRVNFDAIFQAHLIADNQQSIVENVQTGISDNQQSIAQNQQTRIAEIQDSYKEQETTKRLLRTTGNATSALPAFQLSSPDAQTATNGANQKTEPDPRFQAVRNAIAIFWPKTSRFEFDAADGAALNRLLARRPKWKAEELAICVGFRFLSENINPTESVKAWIGSLTDYASGPRDKFNHVQDAALEYHTKQVRRMLWGTEPEQLKLAAKKNTLPDDLVVEGAREAWVSTLKNVAPRLSQHSFDTWLKPLRALGITGHALYIEMPTPEFKHVSDKWGDVLTAALPANLKKLVLIVRYTPSPGEPHRLNEKGW